MMEKKKMKTIIAASATRHHMHQPRRTAHHSRPSHQRMGEMRTILLLASIAYFAWYPYLLTQNPLV
jgi:hypothetical protein